MAQQNGQDLVNSIPSRALDVWRRLYTRYSLEPGPASIAPDVLKTIVPVTQADLLLARHKGIETDTTTTATGLHIAHTVPAGLRQAFITLMIQKTAGGTWTMDRVRAADVSEGTNVAISVQAQTDNFYFVAWAAPLELEEGDSIQIFIDTFVSGSNCALEAWVIEQDIF